MAEALKDDGLTIIMPLLTILIVAKPPKLLYDLRDDNEIYLAARSNANILVFCEGISEKDKEQFGPNQYIFIVDAPGRSPVEPKQEYARLAIEAGMRLTEVYPILIPMGAPCSQFKVVKDQIIATLGRIHKKSAVIAQGAL